MTEPILEIRGMRKAFGDFVVWEGGDLVLQEGETHAVIGGSGTGKSVLLKTVLGLLEPDAGSVRFRGREVVGANGDVRSKIVREIGMLFQDAALFDSMNVGENVAFELEQLKLMKRKAIRERVAEVLEWVGLPGIEKRDPAQLSGGMRKRVGLARALASGPKLMLYDEPTTGLDPITSDVINELIIYLREKTHTSGLVITHDMPSAYKIADRISMLYKGRLIFTGTPEEVRTTDHPVVSQFVHGRAHGPITNGA
ncbi:ABC transporter ATP-binding protein [Thiohalorhabdus sp. Cl-TMA]|uniref:ABC transporter ATP-binding protein n=1 Tax=Thiohalorhabdus methylotrophus TaxID=3242694 RepID=A0ABV4U0G4_9GAMM